MKDLRVKGKNNRMPRGYDWRGIRASIPQWHEYLTEDGWKIGLNALYLRIYTLTKRHAKGHQEAFEECMVDWTTKANKK